ncbi:MAG: bifunctional indole-3-glycerol-phosphate synthase TrpC/phosphoribosylanthranilate isomerase TrpF [Planctomycetota bacterium]|nr:bifunctional indole-3-glycerol-phosphate synthase TrpC/phosphoribosylanthranilate isomerase TrpF [Planctomycetota bacterium]
MVLERIIARKKLEVAERKKLAPRYEALEKSDRSLEESLRQSRHGYIMECKRASPSRGPIAPELKIQDIIEAYSPFADGISVLTDAVDFGGSFDDLEAIRKAVTQPVLCKDFVVDPYQVYEARSHGADAILLMLSVLNDEEFQRCFAATGELAMDALVEVHDQEEMERALKLGARIIGVNNRNLKDLKINLETSEQLIPQIPADKVIISESGILNRDDVRRLRPLCHSFLVGTALLLRGRPQQAARELIFGRVKVCGLTRIHDAQKAKDCGAIYGGLIFAAKSPRCVTEDQAKTLTDAVALKWVGVFVNESADAVARIAKHLKLSAVQLHGDEDAAYITDLRKSIPDCEIWKAVQVQESLPSIDEFGADKLLLDAFSKDMRGGTGHSFDWSLLEDCQDRDKYILAGGLNPENAPYADVWGCFALDVNSGIESAPGQKDPQKIEALFGALRGSI